MRVMRHLWCAFANSRPGTGVTFDFLFEPEELGRSTVPALAVGPLARPARTAASLSSCESALAICEYSGSSLNGDANKCQHPTCHAAEPVRRCLETLSGVHLRCGYTALFCTRWTVLAEFGAVVSFDYPKSAPERLQPSKKLT